MKIIGNKKGFTLVELLAVIVILASVMSVAIVSMGGIMQGAKYNVFKESAAQIIDGVRQQLWLSSEIETGDYYFTNGILDRGGETSPLGGTINYISKEAASEFEPIGTLGVYRVDDELTCSATSPSFVRVSYDGTKYTYSICYTAGAGNKYIDVENGTEANLLNENNTDMIKE